MRIRLDCFYKITKVLTVSMRLFYTITVFATAIKAFLSPLTLHRPSNKLNTITTIADVATLTPTAYLFGNAVTKSVAYSRHGDNRLQSKTALFYGNRRTDIVMPLLDVLDTDFKDQMVQPLPSTHLPDELTTLHVYGMPLTRPVHQQVIQDAIDRAEKGMYTSSASGYPARLFGHIAYKQSTSNDNRDDDNTLVGAIGCAAEILVQGEMVSQSNLENSQSLATSAASPTKNTADATIPKTVLCRGSFRFKVKEIIQSIPFPVAIVDELYDDIPGSSSSGTTRIFDEDSNESDEDDDVDTTGDNDDDFSRMDASQLCRQILQDMQLYTKQQLDATPKEMSPLERSILENDDLSMTTASAQREAAEEMAAVNEVFQQSLIDLFLDPTERYFAIAFMAAEMCNLPNSIRRQILVCTDGIERLRIVGRTLHEMVGMTRARQVVATITKQDPVSEKDLKVGEPQMPPWAKQIRAGTHVEYFWNEDYGWCVGKVVNDPVWIVDEYIVEVYFYDDGTTHRLPFRAEEKVRWRPSLGPK